MAVKIWRNDLHMAKDGINLEKFIENIQENEGDVIAVKALQTKTVGSVKRNTSSPQFMDNRETLSNSTTTATIVAVTYVAYPPKLELNLPAMSDEEAEDMIRKMTATSILTS